MKGHISVNIAINGHFIHFTIYTHVSGLVLSISLSLLKPLIKPFIESINQYNLAVGIVFTKNHQKAHQVPNRIDTGSVYSKFEAA